MLPSLRSTRRSRYASRSLTSLNNHSSPPQLPSSLKLWYPSSPTTIIQRGVSPLRCDAVLSNSSSIGTTEVADVDWDSIGFGLKHTDYMYMMKCNRDGNFSKVELQRFGNTELSPQPE